MRWWIPGALAVFAATPAFANNPTGALHGVVTGSDHGQVVSQVEVVLRSASSPLIEVRATDGDGAFHFDALPPGLYQVEARREGFEGVALQPLLVLPGLERVEHFELPKAVPLAPLRPLPLLDWSAS